MTDFLEQPCLIISRMNGFALTGGKNQESWITTTTIDLNNPFQKWIFTKDSYIKSLTQDLVLDVQHEDTRGGAHIILWIMNGQKNQKWSLTPSGYLQSLRTQFVIDISGENVKEGGVCITYKAQDQLNQFWEVILLDDITRDSLTEIERKNQIVRTLDYKDYCCEVELVNKSSVNLDDPEFWIEGGTADAIQPCEAKKSIRSRLYGNTKENLEAVITYKCGEFRVAISVTLSSSFFRRVNAFNILFIPREKGADEELYNDMKTLETSTQMTTRDRDHIFSGRVSKGNKCLLFLEFK